MNFQQAEQLMANAVKQSVGLIDCKVNDGDANQKKVFFSVTDFSEL